MIDILDIIGVIFTGIVCVCKVIDTCVTLTNRNKKN